jgi:hypothetical protein
MAKETPCGYLLRPQRMKTDDQRARASLTLRVVKLPAAIPVSIM